MIKKYTVLTLTLFLVGQQTNSMTYLRRVSPTLMGVTAVCANYFTKPVNCDTEKDSNYFVKARGLREVKEEAHQTFQAQPAFTDLVDVMERCKKLPNQTYEQSCDEAYEKFKYQVNSNFRREVGGAVGSPIFWADTPEKLTKLIKLGADVNKLDSNGFSLLHSAVLYSSVRDIKLAIIAINAGVNPNITGRLDDGTGLSPLVIAIRKNDPLLVAELLRAGAYVDHFSKTYSSPLLVAMKAKSYAVIPELLKYGAYINKFVCDEYVGYKTILHQMAEDNYDDQETKDLLLYLLQKGANPYATDSQSMRPIDIAAKQNNTDFIKAVGTYKKCSKWRPWELDVTGLSDEQVIDQVLKGKRGSCTR